MTFKLSAQLDKAKDPRLPFEAYRSYVNENVQRFPQSVLDLLDHENWSGGSDSAAPYYSYISNLQVNNLGQSNAELELTLRKEMYVPKPIEIDLKYHGLIQVDIPMPSQLNQNAIIWRYDQFLVASEEEESKAFKHQIEWVNGVIWSVTALEIHASWKNH